MRLSVLTAASALLLLLCIAPSARADSLPSCPPGQRMDCHPSNHHHGCGGCVAIEPVEDEPPEPDGHEEPAPTADEPAPATDEPAPSTDEPAASETSDEEDDGGGGCSVGTAASLGALWVMTPFLLVLGATRLRRRP